LQLQGRRYPAKYALKSFPGQGFVNSQDVFTIDFTQILHLEIFVISAYKCAAYGSQGIGHRVSQIIIVFAGSGKS
jgi:hypothetical protein